MLAGRAAMFRRRADALTFSGLYDADGPGAHGPAGSPDR
jgi:hypothetical protein